MRLPTTARPVQTPLTSAATFATGAAFPPPTVLLVPAKAAAVTVTIASLLFRALLRVTFWGAVAMAIMAGMDRLFGAVV